jgi:predicted metal-dependent peptidase
MAYRPKKRPPAEDNVLAGSEIVRQHPVGRCFPGRFSFRPDEQNLLQRDAWALVRMHESASVETAARLWYADNMSHQSVEFHYNPYRVATPEHWAYVIAHLHLHLVFGHLVPGHMAREWTIACDLFVARWLTDIVIGRPPDDYPVTLPRSVRNVDDFYHELVRSGIPSEFEGYGFAGSRADFETSDRYDAKSWQDEFVKEIEKSAFETLRTTAEKFQDVPAFSLSTRARLARDWFVNRFPMLGALAASFKIIEDEPICSRLNIEVAAVSSMTQEIYVNPKVTLTEEEYRFVIAHELLHVGLRHEVRIQGRDPYLWNVACDYVINQWLVEMQVGELPRLGVLLDLSLKGMSAEAIYDLIVTNLRRFRKSRTFRNDKLGDILDTNPEFWAWVEGRNLDQFYRDCLRNGLKYHEESGRGLLPSGLVEEIRALALPPIPWDVELGHWFDLHFEPLEKRRTYARMSRRQSATPDIPRPALFVPQSLLDVRTFGVVLDTSGSMDRMLLAKALGAIASYAESRDVPNVRVVFCDAMPYDQGYMDVNEIASAVKVRGRGGTVLQPAFDLLETADDFPKDAPILVITDGATDHFKVSREHAFLMPQGRKLPFGPAGPVFWVK